MKPPQLISRAVFFLTVFCLLIPTTFGLSAKGAIMGIVSDVKGTRIREARVLINNSSNRKIREIKTKEDGFFYFADIAPGVYTLTVEKEGYRKFEMVNIRLSAEDRLNLGNKFKLESKGGANSVTAIYQGGQIQLQMEIVLIPEDALDPANHGPSGDGSVEPQVASTNPAQGQNQNPPASTQPQDQTIRVEADPALLQIQAGSGERSDLITNNQVRNLALNGRDLLDLMKLLPGVVSSFNGQISDPGGLGAFVINGTRANQHELAIDGSSNVDTGSNATRHVTINPDAVAEIKVLTANYQAEYGRSAGGFIQIITKSGESEFHGGARYFRRHESLNANNYFNNLQGRRADGSEIQPRSLYRYSSFGYDVGGPVYLPRSVFGPLGGWNKDKNRLFFFWNQEFYRQLVPRNAVRIRVPTAREREGDFSQTLIDGNLVVVDPRTCRPNPQIPNASICDPFPSNKIPQDRWYQYGQAILNLYPMPNLEGDPSVNFISQVSHEAPRLESILRLDYRVSDRSEISGRIVHNSDEQLLPYGVFPGTLNFPFERGSKRTRIAQPRPGFNAVLNFSRSFGDTLTNEFIFGPSRNRIKVEAENDLITRQATEINIPLLFPDANLGDYIPNLRFSGIGGPVTIFQGLPFASSDQTYNFANNLTKVWSAHTLKTGVFVQRSRKDQTAAGALFQTNATIDFSSQDLPPNLNARHPFANALLGNYSSYEQASKSPIAFLRYVNVEGYAQDLWRVNSRLTLEAGLRISWYQPQYDSEMQVAVFNPELFDVSRKVRLYEPTLVGGARRAVDPALIKPGFTPTLNNTQDERFISQIVPNSGDLANGIGAARQGYPRGGFDGRGAQWGPRFGFAYDLLGSGRTVIRGGAGIFYDRIAGDRIRELLANPPNVFTPRFYYGDLGGIENLRQNVNQAFIVPANIIGYARDGKIPTVYSFSLNLQQAIGFGTVLDVAYVGTLSRHLLQERNLNAIQYGTIFKKEAQDPSPFGGTVPDRDPNITLAHGVASLNFDGTKALPVNLLRPFKGYGEIFYREFAGSANYHSLQISARRRFSKDLSLSLAYTWSKALTTADADPDFNIAPVLAQLAHPFNTRDYSYRLASFDRKHVFAASYVYSLPNLSRRFGNNRLAKAVFDGWQLSGISLLTTGEPFEIPLVQDAPFITGSLAITRFDRRQDVAGLVFTRDPQPGKNGLALDPDAFALTPIGDIGPWPRNYLRRPGVNNHDIAILKNFSLGAEGKYLQLRVELFNAFNHTQFSGVNTGFVQARFDAPGYRLEIPTLRGGSRCPATQSQGSCFGEYNAARDPRIVQLGIKLYF
jgi:hypothetical protein